ncbi:MAG: hypothetical protein HGA27_05535 [Peptococcaceae bacterium]|nr:hypothetical protein [Peptococcaceae bacterium]
MIVAAFRRYLAGSAYIFAGLYLIGTKPTGYVAWSGILLCIITAIVSFTKHKEWSIIGGGTLVAGSLLLQSFYSYRCIDCIRADIFIMTGMILVLCLQRTTVKNILFFTVAMVLFFLVGNIAYYFDFKSIIGFMPTAGDIGVNINKEILMDNQIKVFDDKGKVKKIDISIRPILLFSPFCLSCIKTVELLGSVDPNGSRAFVVQTQGDLEEGRLLLRKHGYKGPSYLLAGYWSDSVPAMIMRNHNSRSAIMTNNLGIISKILISDQSNGRN